MPIYEVTVADIVRECNGKLVYGNPNYICEKFCEDTRKIEPNDVYVGIKGENVDGNQLYEKALENGAAVCLLQNVEVSEEAKQKYPDRTIILVQDSLIALQTIAKYKRDFYHIPVVAITGSVGKTSTKDIVASVLSKKFKVLKTIGNYNSDIGLPIMLMNLKDHNAMVLEMGMNHFGEISLLTKIARPDVAVITNIGTAHIGILRFSRKYFESKIRNFRRIK